MNKLRRMGAVLALSLTLAVSAFAGIIHSPGAADPQPPPSEETSTSNTTETDGTATQDGMTTTVILTIFSLLP